MEEEQNNNFDNFDNLDIDIEDLANLTEQEADQEVQTPAFNPVSKQNMEWYYGNLFPFKQFYRWLGRENGEYFERREFSFTLENDIYVRFQSYRSEEEFKKEVMRGLPIKIDIGAVYNTQPKFHNSVMKGDPKGFVPVEKELIFDIDMTDYDDIRTCCKEAKICDKCWKFMIVAYKILNDILAEDFGFENIMWIFSGRRGIHCWVSDERAKKLNNDGRSAIANFIKYRIVNLSTGIKQPLKEPIHPSLDRSIKIIEKHFDEYILRGQDIFKDNKINQLVLMIIKAHFSFKKDLNDKELVLMKILEDKKRDSLKKWTCLQEELINWEQTDKPKNKNDNKNTHTELCLKEIQLNVLYPRLDINVSKHINHLLKSPFCVHPKTGLISVPLNEDDIINFSLDKIPSVTESIDDFMAHKTDGKLQHYLKNFNESVNQFLQANK